MMPAYRDAWLSAQNVSRFTNALRTSAPPIDPDKVKLVLSDRILPNEPQDNCHLVSYPAESQPANLENIFWVIEGPEGERRALAMHRNGLRVRTIANGAYRVYAEFHRTGKPRVISNVAEIKIANIAEADGGGAAPSAKPAKPAAPGKDARAADDSSDEKPAAPPVKAAATANPSEPKIEATPAVKAALAALLSSYAAAKETVAAQQEKWIGALRAWYLQDLTKLQGERTKAADLEGAVAAKTERERITAGAEPTREQIDAMPESLRRVRATYDPALKKGADELARRNDAAGRKYLADLEALQKRLTMGGDLDQAVLVRAEKERAAEEMQKGAAAVAVALSTAPSNPVKRPAAAGDARPLVEFLSGTKWLWYGNKGHVLEFRKDGKVGFTDWTRKGTVTAWEASGPNQVTLTIVSEKRKGRTATLDFSEDRGSFTGIDFDHKTTIAKSPHVAGDDPAAN
jgi:hypothetical protein